MNWLCLVRISWLDLVDIHHLWHGATIVARPISNVSLCLWPGEVLSRYWHVLDGSDLGVHETVLGRSTAIHDRPVLVNSGILLHCPLWQPIRRQRRGRAMYEGDSLTRLCLRHTGTISERAPTMIGLRLNMDAFFQISSGWARRSMKGRSIVLCRIIGGPILAMAVQSPAFPS